MKDFCLWLLFCGILAACTCGGRTNECNERIKLSLLTNIHDDPACEVISKKGVIIYEAAKLIVDAHNMKNDNMKIDVSIMDTCGSIAGTIKAAIKALVSTGLDCIHAPNHLGIIGPESALNVDTVQKITSVLNIPHIVKARISTSPYLHYLAKESEYYIVQGILEVINALRWHSFVLITQKIDDDNHDDDIQTIAKKVTMAAIARGLCVLVLDQDDIETSAVSQIVFIGIPEDEFFHEVNATILIASEGSRATYVSEIEYTNSILFLEDSRDDFDGLESRVINSKWLANGSRTNVYNAEEFRDVRWLKDAINIYTTSLDILCKKNKCSDQINPAEWNSIVATVMATHNSRAAITPKQLKLFIKSPNDNLEEIGQISVLNNYARLHWINDDADESLKNMEIVPESFVDILSNINDKSRINCATLDGTTKKSNSEHEDDVTRIIFTAFGDHEWWTMVAMVGGVGITMFTIGFVAVYIVYINIRGPKASKRNNGDRQVSRDVSLRQVTTPVHHQPSSTIISHHQPQTSPPQRLARYQPRRNSNSSNRSETSDKSV